MILWKVGGGQSIRRNPQTWNVGSEKVYFFVQRAMKVKQGALV